MRWSFGYSTHSSHPIILNSSISCSRNWQNFKRHMESLRYHKYVEIKDVDISFVANVKQILTKFLFSTNTKDMLGAYLWTLKVHTLSSIERRRWGSTCTYLELHWAEEWRLLDEDLLVRTLSSIERRNGDY